MITRESEIAWNAYKKGREVERERIRNAVLEADVALDFHGPYLSKEKLLAVIDEAEEEVNEQP